MVCTGEVFFKGQGEQLESDSEVQQPIIAVKIWPTTYCVSTI